MYKYFDPVTNRSGDSLVGYFVRLFTPAGAEVDIFADESGTPISTVSGVANAAKSDENGMVRFYVANGTYDILYYDSNDTYKSTEVGVPLFEASGVYDDLGSTDAEKGASLVKFESGSTVEDLASDEAGKGASLVTMEGGGTAEAAILARPTTAALASTSGAGMVGLPEGTVADAIKHVTPEMFGAVGDYDLDTQTGTDDSAAFQDAIDYLEAAGGGKLLCSASYLVGGLTIDGEDIVVEGISAVAKIAVKTGELGFSVTKDWVHFRHISIIAQGEKGDAQNTRGILYTKGSTGLSIGHVCNYDVTFGVVIPGDPDGPHCFSGYAIEFRNALDIDMSSCLIYKAKTGLKFGRNGTAGSDFSTTVRLSNFYVIGCDDYGIDATYVYRSSWNVIGEYCGTAIRNTIGDLDLNRCYFEQNTTLGALLTDTGGHDVECYSNNPTTDAVSRVRSVIGNTDWYTCSLKKGVIDAKQFTIQSAWGRDAKTLTGIGTTATIGLKFNEAVMPMVYGDDLLDPGAWASDGTSEFVGWDAVNGGFKIATALTGVRGMKQSVTLDSSKTYVCVLSNKNVAGNPINTVQVDGVARTPGVPFTVGSTGSKVVRCYASQTITSENYVQAFRLMEVLEDQTQIAKTTDRLLRTPGQRAERYASSAPASGYHAVGERVWNSAPTAGGTIGWVCVTAGSPGSWKAFGTIAA